MILECPACGKGIGFAFTWRPTNKPGTSTVRINLDMMSRRRHRYCGLLPLPPQLTTR